MGELTWFIVLWAINIVMALVFIENRIVLRAISKIKIRSLRFIIIITSFTPVIFIHGTVLVLYMFIVIPIKTALRRIEYERNGRR